MSVKIMSEVFERSKTQGNARLILLSLADTCSDEGVCYPSIKKLAKKANISEETTRKFLHAFEKMGLVETEERFNPFGRRTSNTYKIKLDKIGDDELTKDVIYLAIPKSKHRTSDGMNQFTPSPPNLIHTIHPMNQFIPSIMNHHNEPSIEPSSDSATASSNSSNDKTSNGFQTSELFNQQPPADNPPKGRKTRVQKPVDAEFLAELQKLNPDKDVEREAKHAQTWLLSHPERKYSRAFLSAWVIRSKNVVDQNPYRQSF